MHSQLSDLRRICLWGLDPVAASIGLAIRRSGFHGTIYGVDDTNAVKRAWTHGCINDGGANSQVGIKNADLVILSRYCTNPRDRLAEALDTAQPDCILLETSAVKGHETVVFESSTRNDVHYIGFHMVQDDPALTVACNPSPFFLESKAIILTPRIRADYPAYKILAGAFENSGATVIAMSPQAFHERVALMDFVPDLLDFVELEVALMSNRDDKITPEYLGIRLKERLDRLADLHQSSWHDAIVGTRDAVDQQLAVVEQAIQSIRENLRAGSLRNRVASLLVQAEYLQGQGSPAGDLELVVVTGGDPKTMERISKALAEAHVNIEKIEQLRGETNGAYKLIMPDVEACSRAASALKAAGIDTEQLV